MAAQQETLVNAVNNSLKELYQGIDAHCSLVAAMLAQEQEGGGNMPAVLPGVRVQSREQELKNAIQDAIRVLEETRRAFKSKQLERLRKRLTQVLIGGD